jgi:hypothetical protein
MVRSTWTSPQMWLPGCSLKQARKLNTRKKHDKNYQPRAEKLGLLPSTFSPWGTSFIFTFTWYLLYGRQWRLLLSNHNLSLRTVTAIIIYSMAPSMLELNRYHLVLFLWQHHDEDSMTPIWQMRKLKPKYKETSPEQKELHTVNLDLTLPCCLCLAEDTGQSPEGALVSSQSLTQP